MANKYMDERKYLQNGGKYDCQQASRGYRQSQDTSRLTVKQRTSQKSSGDIPCPSPNHGKEHESNQENDKQCEYLKYPLPQPRAQPRGKPSAAANSHQCQVMVNTPRYYKPKPHRHPSALSIPLLSRPESEINLKARSRTKMTDVSSVKDKRRRVNKQRTVTANKHGMNEATQKQRGMQPTDASSASDEDDLRSVSLRAYSSGCLSVDISSQVGDLVKAFNTVSKRHKVKKIVYEEIEPIYPKCELQQLKPQKKNSQKIINDRHLQTSEPNYNFNPGLTEVPETEEEYESKCTCNEQEILMKTTIDQGIGDKKDVDQLEKLFLEVFAQGKVEGLPKQKKLDCLQDAYNQYSAALEDFSNNQEIDSDGCILPQHQSQQNYSNQTPQYVSSGNCEGGTGHQFNAENNLRARRRYRNTRQVEQIPNELINGDEQEAIDETNQEVMQCTCNHENDRSNDNQLTTNELNVNVDYTNFPSSQTDFSKMLTYQRQNRVLENTAESSFENTINDQQDAERFDETYNCNRSNLLTQNQIDSQFRNREHTLVGGIDCRRDSSSLTPDSGIARTLNSKLSTQLHENGKASTPHSSIPCPAPPKLSISDNHFRPDSRNNYCGHIQCFQRSKSKGVEIANMGKRQMMRNKSSDRDSSEPQNLVYNQETPIMQSDFPSEVPNANRSRAEVESGPTILQPRKPVNYDAEVRRAEINGCINNACNKSVKISNSSPQNNPNNQTGNDSIGFNPFLNFLLQNDSNYNIANIVPPEEQSVYFCDVTPDLQHQYNIKQNVDEECDDQNTYTKNPSKADLILNAQSSTKGAKWHDMNRNKAEANPMCTITGNENKLNYRTSDDYSQNTRRVSDGVRESLSINSNEKRSLKASDCNFDQINKTCSDQSSYKNYIESIIDHSTEISANNAQASAPTQSQRSNCQMDTTETATDSAASQVDSKVNQEISQRLTDRLVQSEKAIPPASLVTLEEPEYLQHLKKLRWDHLRHISREVHRLENLERFLDSCGCGHMMIHKGMT
ncbi:uncharacterized protein LOC111046033 [Nilaparvata lugens]|uniref:uncharacterized protein LOC111046033 n=1 Tax=Nilaparvata lugens TaxID=108931 RepID=UPI00193CA03B|nr:uncharacterized protein LOC111046033 [Nilaparvata lugens]